MVSSCINSAIRLRGFFAAFLPVMIKDDVTGALIPGAQFQLTYANGGYVDNDNGHLSSNGLYTTDANGEICISGIVGTVVVREVWAAPGYVIDPATQTQTVTVNPMDTQTLIFYNKPLSGILIHKTDSVTGKGIYGVTFLLYDSAYTPVGQYTSDNQGFVYIEGLAQSGRYYLRELENAGYVPDTQLKTVYVRAGETTLVEWQNTPITGQIQIYKYCPFSGP